MAAQSKSSNVIFSIFKKKRSVSPEPTAAQVVPVHHWSDEEIPRYPPFMKGLPVISPDRLLNTQDELIQRVKNTAIATPEIFDTHYLPAIRRFASFAHLLPASQSHHHRGAGGLFRHALEVGLWALQAADKVMLKNAQSPQHRREMEPRWQLAVFLSALCHDAGKPVTDLHITNMDRSKVWNPLSEDLYAWAMRNDMNAYYLDWREGRGRQHIALSSLVGERIIGVSSIAWIGEGSTELVAWMMESLSNSPSPQNLIHDLVIRADQASVERDLKTLGVAMAGYDIGVPIERHLTELMRRLVRERIWTVNEAGARVWNISGSIYLVWPGAGEELVREIRKDGVPGMPRTPDGLLDMLIDRQLASMRHGKESNTYWQIVPAVLSQKIPDIRLNAIKLRDDTLVSSVPLAQVDGSVIDPDAPTPQQEPQQDKTDLKTEQEKSPSEPEKEPTASEGESGNDSKVEGEDNKPITEPAPTIKNEPERKSKKVESACPQAASNQPESVDVHPPKIEPSITVTAPAEPTPAEATSVEFNGRIGEALKGLAEDLKDGSEKQWGRDVIQLKDGGIQLRWPDALQGCGLQQKVILDELTARNWIVTDAFANHAKVVKARFEGNNDPVPALHLIPSVGRTFTALAKAEGAKPLNKSEDVATKPTKAKKTDKDKKPAKTQQGHQVELPSDSEASTQSSNKTNPEIQATLPTMNDASIEEAKTTAERVLTYPIENVIEALKSTPPAMEKDGWCIMNRTEAIAAMTAHNMPVTGFPGLMEAFKGNEDRVQLLGRQVKYKP